MNDKQLFRILIADDNQASRKGLTALLNSLSSTLNDGMQIEIVGEAENGQEAVDLAIELVPDLIFMDIKMPQLDGLEATEIIKQKHGETKIVVLSMHSDQRGAAFQKGADDFIAKGTDTQNIKQVVLRFFNQQSRKKRS